MKNKQAIVIAILSLLTLYSISAIHYFSGQQTVKTDLKIINEASNIDLSTLKMYRTGHNGNKKLITSVYMPFETNDINMQREFKKTEIYYKGIKVETIKKLVDTIGEEYVRGIKFVDTTSNDSYTYIDKKNNKKLIVPEYKGKGYAGAMVNLVDLYDFSHRFRYPVYKNPFLAVFDPFTTHRHGTFYPLIDILILPLYYFLIILPVIMLKFSKSTKVKELGKTYLKLVILAILITIIYLIWYFFTVIIYI